jgi:hypothetical protein
LHIATLLCSTTRKFSGTFTAYKHASTQSCLGTFPRFEIALDYTYKLQSQGRVSREETPRSQLVSKGNLVANTHGRPHPTPLPHILLKPTMSNEPSKWATSDAKRNARILSTYSTSILFIPLHTWIVGDQRSSETNQTHVIDAHNVDELITKTNEFAMSSIHLPFN